MVNVQPYGQYARNELFACTTTSQQLSPPKERKLFYVRNDGTAGELVTIFFGEGVAVANYGIVLANGQAYIESNSEGFTVWTGPVQVISSANCNITVFER